MTTLADIQAAFAALPAVEPLARCYLVHQDDYDALEAATTQEPYSASEMERGRCATLFPDPDGIRLIPSRGVPRGSLIPMPESPDTVLFTRHATK